MTSPACILYCTCPNADCAQGIAGLVISQGLAACVSLLPAATSFYRWEGELCQDEEVLLMIKTTQARLSELEALITREHPYEVPEFIAVPVIAGSDRYLDWIDTCTTTC
jgi:periplasmic divalent cation tolerance protein